MSEDNIKPVFVAASVDQKNPVCLGKPIKLGKVTRQGASRTTGTAWATEPTSFVMCDGLLLYPTFSTLFSINFR
jgi:hypothetical protein